MIKQIFTRVVAGVVMALPIIFIVAMIAGTMLDYVAVNLANEIYGIDNPLVIFSRDIWSLLGY